MSIGTILLIILILVLLGVLPTWPPSRGWDYYPSDEAVSARERAARLSARAVRHLIDSRCAEDSTMPLSRQVARRENCAQPRLRAAALEGLFRTDWQRSASGSRSNLALTAESYHRARIVVEHVLAPELAAPLTLLAARYA